MEEVPSDCSREGRDPCRQDPHEGKAMHAACCAALRPLCGRAGGAARSCCRHSRMLAGHIGALHYCSSRPLQAGSLTSSLATTAARSAGAERGGRWGRACQPATSCLPACCTSLSIRCSGNGHQVPLTDKFTAAIIPGRESTLTESPCRQSCDHRSPSSQPNPTPPCASPNARSHMQPMLTTYGLADPTRRPVASTRQQ